MRPVHAACNVFYQDKNIHSLPSTQNTKIDRYTMS